MKRSGKTGGGRAAPPSGEEALEWRIGLMAAVLEMLAGLTMAGIGIVTRLALGSALDDAEEIYAAAIPGAALGGMPPDQIRLFMAIAVVILVLGLLLTAAGAASLARRLRRGGRG